MKKNTTKKSMKNVEKKAARKPRLTKEEREARKLKLQEERAAKKAAKLAKREAKKQKEAEKKAAAKAKREERKAKKLARLQKQKEREAAKKLKAKERAKKAELKAKVRNFKKAFNEAKKGTDTKKLSIQEKIEAERNEWKALSALRRYVKDNAKLLASLPEDKRIKRINKLQKMGYSIGLNEDGIPSDIGYSFCTEIKIRGEKPAVEKPAAEKPPKKERKPRKPSAEKVEEAQPQDSAEPISLEELPVETEEKLLTDEEILEAAKSDTDAEVNEEIPVGDTYKEEGEITEDSLKNPADVNDDPFDDGDEDKDDEDDDDDILGFGERDGGISRDQEDYRHEAFSEMEANGAWD